MRMEGVDKGCGCGGRGKASRCRLSGGMRRSVESALHLFSGNKGKVGGGEGESDCRQKLRLFSRTGKPQPHLRHFCPMCCSQIPRQRKSSSAKPLHLLVT